MAKRKHPVLRFLNIKKKIMDLDTALTDQGGVNLDEIANTPASEQVAPAPEPTQEPSVAPSTEAGNSSTLSCAACNGLGLKDEATLCPTCGGTGKVG